MRIGEFGCKMGTETSGKRTDETIQGKLGASTVRGEHTEGCKGTDLNCQSSFAHTTVAQNSYPPVIHGCSRR